MANQGNILIRIGADASQYLKTMKKSTLAMMSMGRRMSSMGAEMTRAFTVPIGLAAGAAIKFAADLDSMERSLAAVMGSSEKAEKELKALRKAALEPGLDFMQAVQGSIRLQSMGLSANKARLFLSGMGRAVELSAGGAAEFSRVMQQVSDIMSRGKVTMEDWKRVAQAAPAVLKAMSEEFGTTNIEAIRATMGVDEFMTRLSEHLVGMQGTGGNLKNTLNNLWTEFRVGMGVIGQSIIKTFDLQKKADDLAVVMRKLSVWIADNGDTIAKWVRKLGPALALLAGLGPVTRLIGNFTMALSQAKMILSVIGTPLAAVTGMTATLAGGMTVAAGATLYWWRELFKLNKELKKYGNTKLTSPLDESFKDLFLMGLAGANPGLAAVAEGRIAAKRGMLQVEENKRADLLGVGSAADLSITGRGYAGVPSAAINNPFSSEKAKQITEAAQKIKEAISDVYGSLGLAVKKSDLFGKNFDEDVIAALEKGIDKLFELGASAESTAVQKFKSLLDYLKGLSKSIDSINTSKFEEDMLTMGAYDKWMAGRVQQLPLTLTASMGTGMYDIKRTDPNSLMGLSLAPQESFMGSLGDDQTMENIEGFNEILERVKVNMEAIHETASFFGDAFVEGFDAATQGAKAFGDFMKRFLADLIKRLLKALIITGLMAIFSGGLSNLKEGLTFGKALMGNLGIGSFAKGGLVYGPQMALVGDNPNASVDPEVIAPLSKLKSMISDVAGGGQTTNVVGKVYGKDLLLVTSNAQRDSRRTGGNVIRI